MALEDDIQFIPVHPRSLLTSLENADRLSEWTPIANQISANETQYYEFLVNTTQTGLGEYYEILIFLSGNICRLPEDMDTSSSPMNQLEVYYSYNQTDLFNLSSTELSIASFEYGYMQALASNPTADPYSNLYIAVKVPDSDSQITGTWNYEMGISQNDLVFQWDDRSWATLMDSDDHSALFITGNLSSLQTGANNDSLDSTFYKMHIYNYDERNSFDGLNRSWCAISSGPALINPENVETELTSRYGNLKQQFFVDGLNSSTSYIAYLTQDFSGTDYGGAIFQQFVFETLEDNACELIYDLEFCDQVAYSVPVSSAFLDPTNESFYHDKGLLGAMYDNHTEELYQNFAKAIQVVNCDDELDARYSPIRTCEDCISSYKRWLCAVSIPRCSTRNVTGYKYREVGDNRNSFIDNVVVPPEPYFEVLPCVETCHAIVSDCPSDFGFVCPTNNETIALSYFWDERNDEGFPTCNHLDSSSFSDERNVVSLIVETSGASVTKISHWVISFVLVNLIWLF